MGRKILVTGCTRGLGRALVNRMIPLGHHVAGCGRSASHIEQLQAQFESPHTFHAVDVTQSDEVQQGADELLESGFVPDLLINNAGVINQNAPLWEVSAAEFQKVLDVNLIGIANTVRAFVPAMIDAGTGIIVNLSSGWGRSVSAEVAPYCASKWGVEGLTKALAEELPAGLAAVPLSPGAVNTEMLQSCMGDHANHSPSPEDWSQQAVDVILSLNVSHNGQSLTT